MRPALRRLDEEGWTLVELLIAMAFTSLLVVAGFQVFESGSRTERAQQARHDALLELRGALDRIAKDTRQATQVSTSSTRSRLEIATTISGVLHDVVYDVADGAVRRTIDGGTPVLLADHVTTATPFCYDPPTCVAPGPTAPTMIRVELGVEPEAFSRGPITLASDIQLRNA